MYTHVCLFFHLYIDPSSYISPSSYSSIHRAIRLSSHPASHLFIQLSIHLSIHSSISRSIHPFIDPPIKHSIKQLSVTPMHTNIHKCIDSHAFRHTYTFYRHTCISTKKTCKYSHGLISTHTV